MLTRYLLDEHHHALGRGTSSPVRWERATDTPLSRRQACRIFDPSWYHGARSPLTAPIGFEHEANRMALTNVVWLVIFWLMQIIAAVAFKYGSME